MRVIQPYLAGVYIIETDHGHFVSEYFKAKYILQ